MVNAGPAPRGKWKSKLQGLDATLTVFKRMPKAVRIAAHNTMRSFVDDIFQTSQDLCPVSQPEDGPPTVAHGHLKSTGGVVEEEQLRFSIVYSAWYAIYVHEVNRHHKVGQWRFLTAAVDHHYSNMISKMGVKFAAEFGATMPGGGPLLTMKSDVFKAHSMFGKAFGAVTRFFGARPSGYRSRKYIIGSTKLFGGPIK